MLGKQDKVAMRLGLLKSLEKSVLGGFVHGVSGANDEIALGGLATIRQCDKLADLLDTNNISFLSRVRLKSECIR